MCIRDRGWIEADLLLKLSLRVGRAVHPGKAVAPEVMRSNRGVRRAGVREDPVQRLESLLEIPPFPLDPGDEQQRFPAQVRALDARAGLRLRDRQVPLGEERPG